MKSTLQWLGIGVLTALLAAFSNAAYAQSIYAANDGNNTIEDYTLSGGNSSATQFANTGLDEPDGLAISDGTVYVANFGNSTIEDYSLAGGNSSATQFANTGLFDPVGLAISGG